MTLVLLAGMDLFAVTANRRYIRLSSTREYALFGVLLAATEIGRRHWRSDSIDAKKLEHTIVLMELPGQPLWKDIDSNLQAVTAICF